MLLLRAVVPPVPVLQVLVHPVSALQVLVRLVSVRRLGHLVGHRQAGVLPVLGVCPCPGLEQTGCCRGVAGVECPCPDLKQKGCCRGVEPRALEYLVLRHLVWLLAWLLQVLRLA